MKRQIKEDRRNNIEISWALYSPSEKIIENFFVDSTGQKPTKSDWQSISKVISIIELGVTKFLDKEFVYARDEGHDRNDALTGIAEIDSTKYYDVIFPGMSGDVKDDGDYVITTLTEEADDIVQNVISHLSRIETSSTIAQALTSGWNLMFYVPADYYYANE